MATGTWDFETRIRRPDGEVHWIWARGRVQKDETGHPARMFGTVADITDRKRAEETNARLAASSRPPAMPSSAKTLTVLFQVGTRVRKGFLAIPLKKSSASQLISSSQLTVIMRR